MGELARAENRRRFLRVAASVYCRPARLRLHPVPVGDIGLGGMRVLTDELTAVGQILDIELLVGDKATAECTVSVAWGSDLPPGSPARFEVGLEFISVPPGFLHALTKIIHQEEPRVLVVVGYQGSPGETFALAQAVHQSLAADQLVDLAVITPAGDRHATRELAAVIDRAGLNDRLRQIESRTATSLGEAFNQAIRQGLAATTAPDFVYLLGAGVCPDPGSLRSLVDFLVTHNDVGILGTRARVAAPGRRPALFCFPSAATDLQIGFAEPPAAELFAGPSALSRREAQSGTTDWVPGGGMMIRREVFDAVGVFDETLAGYFEAADFCWRARAMGWRTQVADQATMAAPSAPDAIADQAVSHSGLLWVTSRQRFYLKHRGRAYLWLANLALAGGLVGAIVRRWLSPARRRRPPTMSADVLRYLLRRRR